MRGIKDDSTLITRAMQKLSLTSSFNGLAIGNKQTGRQSDLPSQNVSALDEEGKRAFAQFANWEGTRPSCTTPYAFQFMFAQFNYPEVSLPARPPACLAWN